MISIGDVLVSTEHVDDILMHAEVDLVASLKPD